MSTVVVAFIYWWSLAEFTIAVGNIKCCSATERITTQSPYCRRLGCEPAFSPAAVLNPPTTLKSKSQNFRFQKKKKKQLQLYHIRREKLIFQANKCQISVTCTITQTNGLDFPPPPEAETDYHTISWCSLPPLPSLICSVHAAFRPWQRTVQSLSRRRLMSASVEVLHRFQISLKKEIIINSAFIALTQSKRTS